MVMVRALNIPPLQMKEGSHIGFHIGKNHKLYLLGKFVMLCHIPTGFTEVKSTQLRRHTS